MANATATVTPSKASNKIENDLLKPDKKTIDTQKVLFLLWKNRLDSKYLIELLKVFSKFIDEKRVYSEIEFFLPQFAHMTINFDETVSTACIHAFEELTLSFAKVSMHTAQQLCFILYAAIEDYQPEDDDGNKNPNFNFNRFLRCARLLKRIEQMVIFRDVSPTAAVISNPDDHATNGSSIPAASTIKGEQIVDKTIVSTTDIIDISENKKSGFLLYKRVKRKNNYSTKPWKRRFFSIKHRILSCYRNADDREPLRSIYLMGCTLIANPQESKYNYTFHLYNKTSYIKFQLRAADEESFNGWISFIQTEMASPPYLVAPRIMTMSTDSTPTPTAATTTASAAAASAVTSTMSVSSANSNQTITTSTDINSVLFKQISSILSSEELNRFQFFHQQIHFIHTLTEISERLRFQDREVRKYFLKNDMKTLKLPTYSYIPLCTSLAPYRCILSTLPQESHAFNTKARCPALMFFETEEHPDGIDTAGFLGKEISEYTSIIPDEIQESKNDGINSINQNKDNKLPISADTLNSYTSKFSRIIAKESKLTGPYWDAEGTGLKKLINTHNLENKNGSMTISIALPSAQLAIKAAASTSNKDGTSKHDSYNQLQNRDSNFEVITDEQSLYQDTDSATVAAVAETETVIDAKKEEGKGDGLHKDNLTTEITVFKEHVQQVFDSRDESLFVTAHAPPSTSNTDKATAATAALASPITKPLMNMETFEEKSERLRLKSEYGHLTNWKLNGLIAKSNDDVRQEVFVMQLIMYFQMAFKSEKVPVWLHTYRILSTSKTTGIIQLIPNATSLDSLKKESNYPGTLRSYFELTYAKPYGGISKDFEPKEFQTAVNEYVKSLAGYSIVSYLLAIKDRHNGNIMIDRSGHLIHIDFGFVFGLAPGKAFSMEKAPFKLTDEIVEVMGGITSPYYEEYCKLCTKAFMVARQHAYAVIQLMEIMSFQSNYPAFKYNHGAIADFHSRLMLDVPDAQVDKEVRKLISKSYRHQGTVFYDKFQLATNGIAV